MKSFKKILAVTSALLLLAMLLAACGGGAAAPAQSQEPSQEASPAPETEGSAAAGTRIITDVFGRQVEIPAQVKNCAAMGAAARIVVYAGGAEGVEKVIGCTQLEVKGAPGMPYGYAYNEHFKNCTVVASGGSGNGDFAEALVELDPDVVFYHDSDTLAMEYLARKTGLPVIGVYGDSFTSHYLTESIALVGDVLGTKEHADEVNASIQSWIQDLDERTKNIPEEDKPSVYVGAVSWSGGHGFTGTYVNYAPLEAINTPTLADQLDAKDGVEVSMEQILEWDPDYIFLDPGNMELVKEDYAAHGAAMDSLRAIREGKVFSQVNFNFYWCNMELAIVDSYYAGSVLYPEAFADIDLDAKAKEVFTTMLGMDYMPVLEANGLSFSPISVGA